MNHTLMDSDNHVTTTKHIHPHSQLTYHSVPHANNSNQLIQPPSNETDAEESDRLLAELLLFYKETSTHIHIHAGSTSTPPLFTELEIFAQKHSLAQQYISQDSKLPFEHNSSSLALLAAPWNEKSLNLTIIDYLFWAITNLCKPGVSFKHSIENNARAVFNAVIETIMVNPRAQDCEQLILLCIHLKDTDSCYPLRALAISTCIENIDDDSLPLYAETAALKFILGPAEFTLHHLETRIRVSEMINMKLAENWFEDIEYWSLVQRVAKKVGSRQPVSPFEITKSKLYRFLEEVVSDPLRYIKQESITRALPLAHWNIALNKDYVVSYYLEEYRPQMLLFLDTLRYMGITPSLLDISFFPDSLSEGVLHVFTKQKQLQSLLAGISEEKFKLDKDSLHDVLEQVFQLICQCQSPFEELQMHLKEACIQLSISVKSPKGDKIVMSKLVNLCDCVKQMFLSVPVIPKHLLPRLLWTAALCLEACKNLEESDSCIPSDQGRVIQEIKATCMDIFLVNVVQRNEPRFPTTSTTKTLATSTTAVLPFIHLIEDLAQSLVLFCLLFPAQDMSTWAYPTSQSYQSTTITFSSSQSGLYSTFITHLFRHLLPLLERVDQLSPEPDTNTILILTAVMFRLLVLQPPSATFYHEKLQISKSLQDISDLKRDSSLESSSALWKALFETASSINPFNIIEARLTALNEGSNN